MSRAPKSKGKTTELRGPKKDPQSFGEKLAKKVVRDSFSMIKADYDLIAALKKRCLSLGLNVNKSQILRAGLNSLDKANDAKLIGLIGKLTEVKTGRPR